ncbi:MAG: tetratricopeptide repeat protein [Cyanobacteria bacterium HKST-UBA02]|nr:tetratricopeptide repeat protein [Cyanobacteria bacterium HKST-UBA02]
MRRSLILILSVFALWASPPALAQNAFRIGDTTVSADIGRRYNEVVMLQRAGKFQEALPKIETLAKDAPDIMPIRCILGEIYVKVGKLEDAYQIAQEVTASAPSAFQGWALLGNACLYSGRKPEALAAYQKYLKLVTDPAGKKQAQGLVTLLTQEIESEKKNTVASPPGTYLSAATVYGVTRWTSDKMPLKVFISDGSAVKGYRKPFLGILKDAFSEWQDRSDRTVSFTYVPDAKESDIECYWSDDKAKLYNPSEGGHTMFIDRPTGRVHAEIVLLTSKGLKEEDDESIMFRALHEIGHALGITGHSSNTADVMYMGETDRVHALTDADVATLKALYTLEPTKRTESHLKESLALSHSDNPLNKAILLNQEGGELFNQKKFKESAEKFRQAAKLAPSLGVARENLGVALNSVAVELIRSGDFASAEPILKEAITCVEGDPKLNDKLSLLLNNYQIVLTNLSRPQEAEAVAKRRQELQGKP